METFIAVAVIVVIIIAELQGAEWPGKIFMWWLAIIFSPVLLVMVGLPKLGVPEKHWCLAPLAAVFQITVVFGGLYLFRSMIS